MTQAPPWRVGQRGDGVVGWGRERPTLTSCLRKGANYKTQVAC